MDCWRYQRDLWAAMRVIPVIIILLFVGRVLKVLKGVKVTQ